MKYFNDHIGIPLSSIGTISTITVAYVNEHLSEIAAFLTISYTLLCILHKLLMLTSDWKSVKERRESREKKKKKND